MVVAEPATAVAENLLHIGGIPVDRWIDETGSAAVWFRLLQQRRPNNAEIRLLEALLASMADHGSTPPSTQAARLVASTGVPLQASLAAGLLAFGEHHAGAIELSMRLLQENVPCMPEVRAADLVTAALAEGQRIPGFGHRIHRRDPRVEPLLALASNLLPHGTHLALFRSLRDELEARKEIAPNIDGIGGAILSDLGFPWQAGRAFFFAGRLPGLVAHILGETMGNRAFRRYELVAREEEC